MFMDISHHQLVTNKVRIPGVKPVMTKLQNVFVALVNMDIFQMTLKLRLLAVDF